MGYYSALKRNILLIHIETWGDSQKHMPSEKSQTLRALYSRFHLRCSETGKSTGQKTERCLLELSAAFTLRDKGIFVGDGTPLCLH